MDRKTNTLEEKLQGKRSLTEHKIRQLEQANRAGTRYTAVISNVSFLVLALLCDAGWLAHLIFALLYWIGYGWLFVSVRLLVLNWLSLAALAVVVLGIAVTIYLNRIHEKEIATRWQKNLSFGATAFGGLAAGVIGALQLMAAVVDGAGGIPLLAGITAGGFVTFAFGLPIFLSFRKGIFYHGANGFSQQ